MKFSTLCAGCGVSFPSSGAARNHGRYSTTCTPEMRFWGKIVKSDGCWLWQGAINTTGYGMANWPGQKNIPAHRRAYELLRGPIQEGMLALHKCDTPRCCNPDHLFFGTDADNCADKIAKDRHARGERSGHAVLTAAQVLEIRRDYRRTSYHKSNLNELAARYPGVDRHTIYAAATGRSWKYL